MSVCTYDIANMYAKRAIAGKMKLMRTQSKNVRVRITFPPAHTLSFYAMYEVSAFSDFIVANFQHFIMTISHYIDLIIWNVSMSG